MNTPRPDPDDPAFVRAVDEKIAEYIQRRLALPKEDWRKRERAFLRSLALKLVFWGFALGAAALMVGWLAKQLL